MRTRPKILLFYISILLVTLACNIGKEPEGTTTPEQGEETTTEMTATSTEEQISSSETPQPSETLNPTLTIIPTLTNTAIPCDLVGWGSETIPDGTKFDPGEAFTKTWQLINRGSCAWTSGYQVVFVNGDQMNGPDSKSVTSGTVAPGSSVQIEIDLVAPD